MPARLKTHLVILSHRREKKIMKIVGYIANPERRPLVGEEIISYIFHAHRRHSFLTLGFRLRAEKSRKNRAEMERRVSVFE